MAITKEQKELQGVKISNPEIWTLDKTFDFGEIKDEKFCSHPI
jgi:hypothetical protein